MTTTNTTTVPVVNDPVFGSDLETALAGYRYQMIDDNGEPQGEPYAVPLPALVDQMGAGIGQAKGIMADLPGFTFYTIDHPDTGKPVLWIKSPNGAFCQMNTAISRFKRFGTVQQDNPGMQPAEILSRLFNGKREQKRTRIVRPNFAAFAPKTKK